MCEALDDQRRMSRVYHPQTDGQSERTNQTIEQMLQCSFLGDDSEWASILRLSEFAHHSTLRVLNGTMDSRRQVLSANDYSYRHRGRPTTTPSKVQAERGQARTRQRTSVSGALRGQASKACRLQSGEMSVAEDNRSTKFRG